MNNLFFTSDQHFFHALLARERGFESIEEMNEVLIDAHNKVTNDKSIVWMLGDIAFGRPENTFKILKRLKGRFNLCLGNHDQRYKKAYAKSGLFQSISDFKEIKVDRQKVSLFHYSMETFPSSHYGAWHLFGHSHTKLPFNPSIKKLDVGIDGRADFSPYSFEEIKQIFDNPTDFKYYKHETQNSN